MRGRNGQMGGRDIDGCVSFNSEEQFSVWISKLVLMNQRDSKD